MRTRMWLSCLCVLGILFMVENANGVWVSRPGTIRQCVHDDAEFHWLFKATDEDDASQNIQIFWIFMVTGETLLGWYSNTNSTHIYPNYEGRVQLLDGYNAGIVLTNVTEKDSGWYRVEVTGLGLLDMAQLSVHSRESLKPQLKVDNIDVNFGSVLNLMDQSRSTITLRTSQDLAANITIEIEGFLSSSCSMQSLCTAIVVFSEISLTNISVRMEVDYGVCDKHQYILYMTTDEDASTSLPLTVIVIAVIVVVVIIVIVVVSIIFWRRHNNAKRTGGRPKGIETQTSISSKSSNHSEETGADRMSKQDGSFERLPVVESHFSGEDLSPPPTKLSPVIASNTNFIQKIFPKRTFSFRKLRFTLAKSDNIIENKKRGNEETAFHQQGEKEAPGSDINDLEMEPLGMGADDKLTTKDTPAGETTVKKTSYASGRDRKKKQGALADPHTERLVDIYPCVN